jgi:hypothetical protein
MEGIIMTHYLKSKDGKFELDVEMECGHPDMRGNSTSSVGCDGKCEDCDYSVAKCTIPEMMELLRRADCTWRR